MCRAVVLCAERPLGEMDGSQFQFVLQLLLALCQNVLECRCPTFAWESLFYECRIIPKSLDICTIALSIGH